MIWFYRLCFLPGLLLALPYYTLRMWRRGGYARSFSHRFGFLPPLPPAQDRIRIWIQAVSVGEILAIGPLISSLKKNPKVDIVLTTTTSTGYTEARRRYADSAFALGIFPIDFWLCSRIAWKRIQPDAIIQTESELWPEHLHQAKKHSVPIYLVNARISDRSFKRYQTLRSVACRLFGKIDRIFAASDLDRERVIDLGAAPSKVESLGSIKFDVSIGHPLSVDEKAELLTELGFTSKAKKKKPFVLVGASTWPGEELVLMDAQKQLKALGVDCRLLIVPRHAEKAPEIVSQLQAPSLIWHQRSTLGESKPPDYSEIYLADTTGELARLIQAGDLVFIGKSLPPHSGGQTPIEAAGLNLPILMGPNMENFREIAVSLVQCGAAEQICDAEGLKSAVIELCNTPLKRAEMAQCGLEWHQHNRGSSQRICTSLLQELDSTRYGS